MGTNRLEAFSDGVIAVIITIMVLEMKAPVGTRFSDLQVVAPAFLCYVLSFVLMGIYWCNHHHLIHATQSVNGTVLWANLNLLFWLSLVPFCTQYMSVNGFTPVPVATYGTDLLLSAVSYWLLVRALISHHGRDSKLARAIGKDWKGTLSIAIYGLGIGLSFVQPVLGYSMYGVVALIWLVPDTRIERKVTGPTK